MCKCGSAALWLLFYLLFSRIKSTAFYFSVLQVFFSLLVLAIEYTAVVVVVVAAAAQAAAAEEISSIIEKEGIAQTEATFERANE